MSRTGTWICLVAWGLLSAGALAQEEPDRDEPPEPPADEEPETRGAEDAPRDTEVEDEVFIPSEEIPADEEVTFPVNI